MNWKLVVILIIISACSDRAITNKPEISLFYNLDSLLDAQIIKLASSEREVRKTVRIDNQSEESVIRFDSVRWKEELGPVRDLDLNFPIYAGAIDTQKSPLKIQYQPSKDQDVNVKYVVFEFGEGGDIVFLEGKFVDDKAGKIYATERTISLQFEDNLLKKYRIFGYQKMVTRDTAFFEVKGEVLP